MREQPATREAFSRALVDFVTALVSSRRGNRMVTLDESTALFETGLIDSLGILELLAFVEETTGHAVPIRQVDLRFFRTVECISRSFWRGAQESAHEPTVPTFGAGQNRA